MAKKAKFIVRMQIPGGGATPALGSVLGQYQIKMMDFFKAFNAETANRKGSTVPVVLNIYSDKTFDFVCKTAPVSEELRKRANITKGSSNPGTEVCGAISWSEIEEIAKIKMVDLNAKDLEGAKKIIAGSARSMGLEVK